MVFLKQGVAWLKRLHSGKRDRFNHPATCAARLLTIALLTSNVSNWPNEKLGSCPFVTSPASARCDQTLLAHPWI
jgi:hypothetical protein